LKPCVVINKVDKENCTWRSSWKGFWSNVWIRCRMAVDFQQFMVLLKITGCLTIGKT
jgi:hypothetical protein